MVWALIGAGPMGLACAKTLQEQGIAFQGFEVHRDVGGLWDITGLRSTMYETAHLISSKTKTEFTDFPMTPDTPDYPSHRRVAQYLRDFATRFDVRRHFRFGVEVTELLPLDRGWRLRWREGDETHEGVFEGVLIANGTLSEPNMPRFDGHFAGELIHSSAYREPRQMQGKRVLVIGGGNSGCDIAVDGAYHAVSTDLSLRRGYHFVPKYLFGRPADTVGGALRLPMAIKRRIDGTILRWFVGDAQRVGFPAPDHRLYESHPVVNSLVVHHAGHGDIVVRPDIARFDGDEAVFVDGTRQAYDMVIAATGYRLHYPFIAQEHLNWHGAAPHLFLNCMHPGRDDLFVMGMLEATGLGWQGRHEQAELVARYIAGLARGTPAARAIQAEKSGGFSRLTGGIDYVDLPRMAYYVEKSAYRAAVMARIRALGG